MARQYTLFNPDHAQLRKERVEALKALMPQHSDPKNDQGPVETGTGKKIEDMEIPEWAAKEIRDTWKAMRSCDGQLEAYRLCERMVDRLGYNRMKNPSLI